MSIEEKKNLWWGGRVVPLSGSFLSKDPLLFHGRESIPRAVTATHLDESGLPCSCPG